MNMTEKQMQIMRVVLRGNEDGSFCDMDELLKRLPYKVSKMALQFSIRALIKNGLLIKQERELRRGRRRVVFSATELGFQLMRHG